MVVREAAVLGTPAYSVFAGKLGAVDRALVAQGKLKLVTSGADVDAMQFAGTPGDVPPEVDRGLLVQFVDRLLALADQ